MAFLGLALDAESAVPTFLQLRAQLIDLVRSGALTPGTRIPTVRALAGELGIAPNTVAKAYRQLEEDGILETRGRNGSFISPQGGAAERKAQEAALAYAARVRQLGIPPEQALGYVEAALQGHSEPPWSAPGEAAP
ncbi:GntR family transcriptional regulator [Lysobacter korlensis]|uniref:GntR family transcriptional regulator n=1 Tax=Lysobacter korlensis TaxID=553636 RepID=A0ABV6RTC7_9GAMM